MVLLFVVIIKLQISMHNFIIYILLLDTILRWEYIIVSGKMSYISEWFYDGPPCVFRKIGEIVSIDNECPMIILACDNFILQTILL